MGLLDKLSSAADAAGLGQVAKQMAGLVNPQELINLQTTAKIIADKITALTAALPANPSQQTEIDQLRVLLMSYFQNLRDGGAPPPDLARKTQIMAMPAYQKLLDDYPTLDQAVTTLEGQYRLCTFGYRKPDGSIVRPDVKMAEADLQQLVSQSADQTARCWLTSDPTQYVS